MSDATLIQMLVNNGGAVAFAAVVYMELRALRVELRNLHGALLCLAGARAPIHGGNDDGTP